MKSPILCLYGPPGVGKTSLGKSIAEAIGRKYVRMSLGGLHDESEIRGHRKTYIGAMPGKLISNLKKVGTSNPVFVLDEIDKVGRSGHGDPSSALLEVLDPEQNDTFQDNFVEIEYDLSKVLFIATANDLSTIQPALRDRMEIIPINGYTIEEKVQIAKKHLMPKLIKDHGIGKENIKINQIIIEKVITSYTNESGVRGLDKKLAKLIRNRAKQIAFEEQYHVQVSKEDVLKSLGPGMDPRKYSEHVIPGVVTGLAWTRTGGDILFIESSKTKGKGKLTLTGNLGDVMKESAVIALEYIKANGDKFGIKQNDMEESNFHIHVPEGATPKDGPSAGVTMITALASSITGKKVKKYLAMTGEITLRGEVLAIGGVKEKILAAKRAGIRFILLPEANQKDVNDIKKDYLKGLTFNYVKKMEDVINYALT
jgi:ATP-dependent Lon protease